MDKSLCFDGINLNDDEKTKIKLLLMFTAILLIGYFPIVIYRFSQLINYKFESSIDG